MKRIYSDLFKAKVWDKLVRLEFPSLTADATFGEDESNEKAGVLETLGVSLKYEC